MCDDVLTAEWPGVISRTDRCTVAAGNGASVPRSAAATSDMTHSDLQALLATALEGDSSAVRTLVRSLTPVVQCRVARALLRRHAQARGRNLRQELEDLTQEVFVALFSNDLRALRAWDPNAGLGVRSFVGLIAEREVASIMRSGRRSPWTEDPTTNASLEAVGPTERDPEGSAASRQLARTMLDRLRAELSPLGIRVFELLWRDQKSVEEACAELAMSADALYAWRSRIRKTARAIADDLGETREPRRGTGT
jgi:DNA-directed RNA polymerase specialized sigma24 family protein